MSWKLLLDRFKSRGRPSPFSLADMNALVDRLNAWQRAKIVAGGKDEVVITPHSVVISYRNNSGGTSSTPSGATVKQLTVTTIEDDYLIGTDEGGNYLKVAKPRELRGSLTSENVGGTDYTYSSYSKANSTRTASWATGNSENQVIHPPYAVGKVIYADEADATGVTVDGVELTLIEQSGREWASVTEKNVVGAVNLAAGVNYVVVTGLALASTPRVVIPHVHGAPITAFISSDHYEDITTDGFRVELSGSTPNNNCRLHYSVWL